MIHPWKNPEGRVPQTHGCLASVRSARKLEAALAGLKGHVDPKSLCDAAKDSHGRSAMLIAQADHPHRYDARAPVGPLVAPLLRFDLEHHARVRCAATVVVP